MKKKLLTMLLAVCAAICLCFGFSACGESTETVTIERISLNKTELTLNVGGEETLTVALTPDNATNKTVAWSSSDPTIATVNSTGKITAVKEGAATITATTVNNKTATCNVTVSEAMVTAEQWTAAFSENNMSYTMIMTNNTAFPSLDYPFVGTAYDCSRGYIYYHEPMYNDYQPETYAIYTKEEDNFYEYTSLDGVSWTRKSLDEDEYDGILNNAEMYSKIFSDLADDYGSFTYADGKYTAADGIYLESGGMKVKEIIFENGKLKTVTMVLDHFDGVGSTTFYIEIGEAEIEIPINFTDAE